jgi:Mn2+/Fe2+ NRAMP family transporter
MQALKAPALLEAPARGEAAAPRGARSVATEELRRIGWDTWSGMLYSDVTAYFIVLATALTLHAAGIHTIDTAAQAANALRPIAGNFAFELFAIGIIGAGLVGVPVLAGSGAYAMCEAMGWPFGLEREWREARGFYGVIAASVLAALLIQYSPISPMKALFWSAVINGIVAVPLMAVITLLVSKKSVMGPYTASRTISVLGWLATLLMGAAAVRMFVPD